jgi:hypothetical protein
MYNCFKLLVIYMYQAGIYLHIDTPPTKFTETVIEIHEVHVGRLSRDCPDVHIIL